jgi:hypothetical protein
MTNNDEMYRNTLQEIDKKIYQMQVELNTNIKKDIISYIDHLEIRRFRDILAFCWKLIRIWFKLDKSK